MFDDRLFESILDDYTADDTRSATDVLSGQIQTDNDTALDDENIPRTDRFTQMLAFMIGLRTGTKPVTGLIRQELDRFIRDCDDILTQTPEVHDYTVQVLTAERTYEQMDPRIRIIGSAVSLRAGRMSSFRLNFCVCWDRPLKNPRTLQLLMRAFNASLRRCEFLLFDDMCCRTVEDGYWKGRYWVSQQTFDDYISVQQELKDVVKDYEKDFWNVYNLQKFLCPHPKTFYNLRKQYGDFDYSTMMYRHMLSGIVNDLRLFRFYGDDCLSEYTVPAGGDVQKLVGTTVGPQILQDYRYAVVCAKCASTSDFDTRSTYCQFSSAMGNDAVQNAVRAQLYARKAVIRKVSFMKATTRDVMCFVLLDPVWVPEGLTMYYFGLIYIAQEEGQSRSLTRLVSEMYRSFDSRPTVSQKAVCRELTGAPLKERFWQHRD